MKTLFVLGAGSMGAGIAETGVRSGLKVILCDSVENQLDRAKERMIRSFDKYVAKGRMTEDERVIALSLLNTTTAMEDAAEADYVIEAIFEDIDAKREALKKLSGICGENTIIGSNTSTISISKLSSAVRYPERFMGTHFFNPVPVMKLLELVRGIATADETVTAFENFAECIGKTTILSKDSCGFIANRIGSPMLNAAVNAFDSGIGSAEDIDNAMKLGWNFPMGLLELIDLVGLDVQLAVMEQLYAEFGEPYYKPAPLLKRMVAVGRLGRKSGRGFYDYSK